MHGRVGERRLAGLLQQAFHQELAAGEIDLALEFGAIAQLLVLGGLGHQHHVGGELHQIVALGVRRHGRELAGLFLGDVEVALVDFHAVDLGEHRVVLGQDGLDGQDQQGQSGGEQAGPAQRDRAAGRGGNGHGRSSAVLGSIGGPRGADGADLSPNNHGFAMAE